MSQFRFLQQLGAVPESDEEEIGASLGLVDQNRLKQELDNKRGNLFADGKNIDLDKAQQSHMDYIKQLQSPNEHPEREDTRDEPLTQPWYSPDELLVQAATPGLSKGLSSASRMLAPEVKAAYLAGKNALTGGEGILGNEIGAIGRKINPDFKPKWITAADKMVPKSDTPGAAGRVLDGKYWDSRVVPVESAELIAQRKLNHAKGKAKYAAGADKRAEKSIITNKDTFNRQSADKARRMELSQDVPEGVTPNIDDSLYTSEGKANATRHIHDSVLKGTDWNTMLSTLPKMNTEAFNKILSQKENYMEKLLQKTPIDFYKK